MSTTKRIWQGASLIDGAPIGAFLTIPVHGSGKKYAIQLQEVRS